MYIFCTVLLCFGVFFPVFPSSLTRLCRIQYAATSVSSCGNHTITTRVLCQECSTSVEEHHSCRVQVSSILQQWMVDDLLLMAIGAQHHGSHHKIVLQKSCFEINVKKIPSFAGCHLTAHSNPDLVEAGESVRKYSVCLSWKPLLTHLAFALRKLSCLAVVIVSTHRPETSFLGLTFLLSMRSKNCYQPRICTQKNGFCFSIFFVISSYFLG